jgi:hypothetical protein
MPVYWVLPERLRMLSVQAECLLRPSGPLLIRGFGVRVPGGAPVLSWGFLGSSFILLARRGTTQSAALMHTTHTVHRWRTRTVIPVV